MFDRTEIESMIEKLVEVRKRHLQATMVLELCEGDLAKRRAEIGSDESLITGKNAEIRKEQLLIACASDERIQEHTKRVSIIKKELGIADIEVEAARKRISLTEAWLRGQAT